MGSAGKPNKVQAPSMLALFTDYGWSDPYVGQIKAVLAREAPGVPVIDLLHAVPDFNAHAGAQLLDALSHSFSVGTVFFCVIDPGVGVERDALVVEADGRWFVGPDNGFPSFLRVPSRFACGRFIGVRNAYLPLFMAASCSRRLQPGSPPENFPPIN
jgi:S-adenosylmethionine hydrolase